ncbi:hypothetical protein D9M68_832510 [compost metagenome]
MGLGAAHHELFSFAAGEREQGIVRTGGEGDLLQDRRRIQPLTQSRDRETQALGVLLAGDYRHLQTLCHAQQPAGVLDHCGAVIDGRQQFFLDIHNQQYGIPCPNQHFTPLSILAPRRQKQHLDA